MDKKSLLLGIANNYVYIFFIVQTEPHADTNIQCVPKQAITSHFCHPSELATGVQIKMLPSCRLCALPRANHTCRLAQTTE